MGVATGYSAQEDVQPSTTSTRPQRSAKRKSPIVIDDDDEEEESYEPVKKRARKQSKTTVAATSGPAASAGGAKADRLAAARARVLAELRGYQNENKKASSKQTVTKSGSKAKLLEEDEQVELEDYAPLPVKPTKGQAKKKAANPTEEKRAKRFREKAPQSFAELFDRATTQRMFVLDRIQTASSAAPPSASTAAPLTYAAAPTPPTPAARPASAPSARVHLAGTTGNIYTVHITHVPTCSCPAYTKAKSPCKHVIYVLHHVLKAPANLVYQLAFLTSELVQIFAHAPPPPGAGGVDANTAGNRKPLEDDCPICCCEFEPGEPASATVFCRAACGNNMHTTCFSQWAASKRATGSVVTCPFCRTPWQAGEQDISAAAKDAIGSVVAGTAQVNADGYVNIAGALGISGKRDYSTVSGCNGGKMWRSKVC